MDNQESIFLSPEYYKISATNYLDEGYLYSVNISQSCYKIELADGEDDSVFDVDDDLCFFENYDSSFIALSFFMHHLDFEKLIIDKKIILIKNQ